MATGVRTFRVDDLTEGGGNVVEVIVIEFDNVRRRLQGKHRRHHGGIGQFRPEIVGNGHGFESGDQGRVEPRAGAPAHLAQRGLRKDNTGYDLKHLFIGAEGTLGIITAAVLKLFPLPVRQSTVWLNVASPAAAVALLTAAKAAFDAQLTAFELISETALSLVLRHIPGASRPGGASPWYVLAEFSDADPEQVEQWLAARLAEGVVLDGTLARSEAQARQLWALRECISEAQKIEGFSIKHDIAVPVSRLPEFLERADAVLGKAYPGIRVVAFGHVGDGNLHYNLSRAEAQDNAAFLAAQPEVNLLVHDLVHALNGSISAEHGLGQLKRVEILRYKSPLEMSLMRQIKQALDPAGLMNPGKLI